MATFSRVGFPYLFPSTTSGWDERMGRVNRLNKIPWADGLMDYMCGWNWMTEWIGWAGGMRVWIRWVDGGMGSINWIGEWDDRVDWADLIWWVWEKSRWNAPESKALKDPDGISSPRETMRYSVQKKKTLFGFFFFLVPFNSPLFLSSGSEDTMTT